MVQEKGSALKRKHLQYTIKILLGLLIVIAFYTLFRNGASWLEDFNRHNWEFNLIFLSASAVLLIASLVLAPAGWVMVSRSMGSKSSAGDLFAAWYASQLGRYIPGKVWLFAGRAGFLKSRGMKTGRAAATTAYELFFNVASVGLIALAGSLLVQGIQFTGTGKTAVMAAGSALLLIPLLHPVQRFLCRKKGIPYDSLPSPAVSVRMILIFTVLWLLRGISLYLLLLGTGITQTSIARSVIAAPLSWFAGYIVVIVPGGIGIREAAAAVLSAPMAIVPATAVIAGQRIFMALIEVILALISSKRITTPWKEDECL